MIVRNVSREPVEFDGNFLVPNATVEVWPTRYLWDDCGLRQLIDDGLLRVDPDPPETCH
jgi:hypothetical protein